MTPKVSIVLPLYNAVAHLERGLSGIESQLFQDWELIAVNDGSSDATREQFLARTKHWSQPIKLVDRENGGGFTARNTGLDHVSGEYIAFLDIDDRWYPHHLASLVQVLDTHADVDWVYAACKLVDLTQDGKVVEESNFLEQGKERPFLSLQTEKRGLLHVLTDSRAAEMQLRSGLHIGQQFSLVRRAFFATYRFRSSYRNEGADQVAFVTALKTGLRFAYLREIHGEYMIHTGNASAGCRGAPLEKYLRLKKAYIRGLKELDSEMDFTADELRALHERLSDEYFWRLGYNLYLQGGMFREAEAAFRLGLFYSPWDWKKWKTFALFWLRHRAFRSLPSAS